MKKILLFIFATASIGLLNAQIYEASDTTAFMDWTSVDADGDGLGWILVDITATTLPMADQGECILSNSWSGDPLTPDNWLVSPVMDLSAETGEVWLNFKAGNPETTDSGWYEEYFSVYAVEDASIPTLQAATAIWEGALEGGAEMFSFNFDISDVAGSATAYVAIRHHNCTDENFIVLDDLTVTNTFVGVPENDFEANMFPNPVISDLNISIEGQIQSVLIYAMDGKLVTAEGFSSSMVSMDLSGLNTGLYVAFITDESGLTSRQKFMKQ